MNVGEKQIYGKAIQVEQMEAKASRHSVPREDKQDENPKPIVPLCCTLPRAANSWPTRPQNQTENKAALRTKPSFPPPVFPKHSVLTKDGSLLEKSNQLSGRVSVLEEEYQRMLDFVQENVIKQVKVARLKENAKHNRYLDIGL